ncbi:MAG: precorrin-6y C5,15-methyltransferase (decarboxylating) subunit CbiE [Acidiphilium sp.]|nr:precorrin-6y C5,15-methyltransferase (decarboxylating) subunit CbiE [Acidiphilium sp.]MDD4935579.1 precorrin-6y C5,15-methyltransferase (decarboxylating) subunit CbiE [Acidiphilium sp.]
MTQSHWLSILGIGEDGVEGLSAIARGLIAGASLVVGGARHLRLAAPLIAGETMAWPNPIDDAFPTILAHRGESVVVLASGDPFFHGIGSSLARLVGRDEFICLPVPSCVSLAVARLGWALQDTPVISCCGPPVARLIPHLHEDARLLVLSADATTPPAVAALLRGRGFGHSRLHLLEALGGPDERYRQLTVADVLPDDIAALNLIAIEARAEPGAVIIPCIPGLPDSMFAHDGQITKHEIRAATLAALAPTPRALLWDIGCGSGSVSIEWLLAHPANRAIALDRDETRAVRARGNALLLGVPSLDVRIGTAPGAIDDAWPRPDAVFIGGGAQIPDVIDAGWNALRPGGRIVVNAVTIETEAALFAAHKAYGGTLTRLAIDRLDSLGHLHGFRPAMTVTQWRGVKP